jgi:hypothetical protein
MRQPRGTGLHTTKLIQRGLRTYRLILGPIYHTFTIHPVPRTGIPTKQGSKMDISLAMGECGEAKVETRNLGYKIALREAYLEGFQHALSHGGFPAVLLL